LHIGLKSERSLVDSLITNFLGDRFSMLLNFCAIRFFFTANRIFFQNLIWGFIIFGDSLVESDFFLFSDNLSKADLIFDDLYC